MMEQLTKVEYEELLELFLQGFQPLQDAEFEDTLAFAYWILDVGKNTIPNSYHIETVLHTYTIDELKEFIQLWIPNLPDPIKCGTYKGKHLTKFINAIK